MILDDPATYFLLCGGAVLTLGVVCSRAVTRETDRAQFALGMLAGLVSLAYGLSSLARLGALPGGATYDSLSFILWLLIAGLLVVLVVGRRLDTDT